MRAGLRWRIRRLDAALRRRNLARGAATILTVGSLVVIGAMAYFGELVEDVTRHNDLVASDAANLHWFTERRSTAAIDVSRALDHVVNPFALGAIAVLVGALLWWHGQRLFVAVAPALSLAVAGVVARIVKSVVERSRPPVAVQLVTERDSSFPAAHAAEAAALVLTCALILSVFVFRRRLTRWLAVGGGVLVVLVVGGSRLVLGVHWPSDVVAGALLGLAIAISVTIGAVLLDAMTPGDWPARPRDRVWRLVNHRRRRPVMRTT